MSSQEVAKAHYAAMSRYLQPQPGASPSDLAAIDLRREAQQAEFDLQRYTIHSHLLWSAPPYSPAILEFGTCLNMWVNSSLPETAATEPDQSPPSPTPAPTKARASARPVRPVLTSSLSETDTRPATSAVPFPRGRERRLAHKSSLPAIPSPSKLATERDPTVGPRPPPTALVKQKVDRALQELAGRKDVLETAWAERDERMRSLEIAAEEKALAVTHLRASSNHLVVPERTYGGGRKSMEDGRPASTSPVLGSSGFITGNTDAFGFGKDKKHRGVGSRIKGMLSSTTLSSNLSSMSGGFKLPTSSSSASLAQSSRMSLQLPSRGNQAVVPEQGRVRRSSSRHSIQAVPGEGYSNPFVPLFPQGQDLTSPLSPSELSLAGESPLPASAPSMPMFRDLQVGTASELMHQELQREAAGRKKEGLLWSPGVWEDVAGASANRSGDRKDRAKWDSECGGAILLFVMWLTYGCPQSIGLF
jgi:hypothetical protein